MKKWFQKTLAITVAFLTFGVITPDHEIWAAFDEQGATKPLVYERSNDILETYQLDELIEEEQPLESLFEKAKEQSYIKFGKKVAPVIADEFDEVIYPKMVEAIEMVASQYGEGNFQHLAITEMPSGDYSEKIFNVYDETTKKDIIRFHVRIENRPFEGHYYNFHYHTFADKFVSHYNLGEIFWSKNTPPKWLS